MPRSFLAQIHNPMALTCGCPPECWCKRTRLGRLVRWYVPNEYHHAMRQARRRTADSA